MQINIDLMKLGSYSFYGIVDLVRISDFARVLTTPCVTNI
jgi:hypothetical protein